MSKRIDIFSSKVFRFLLLFLFSFLNSFSRDNPDDVVVESDFFEGHTSYSYNYGNVVLKKSDLILNTENLYTLKINLLKGKKDERKNIISFVDSPFKILLDDGTYIYGKYLKYERGNFDNYIKYTQIFPGDNNTSILAEKITQKDQDDYLIEDCTISSCILGEENLIEQQKELEKGIDKIDQIEVPKRSIFSEPFNSIKWSYFLSPWSVSASKIAIDKKEKMSYIHNAVVRIGPVPIFYIPYQPYTIDKKKGQSGILMLKFHLGAGLVQQGIEIPLYIRLSTNADLIISRSEYFRAFPFFKQLKEINDPKMSSLDFQKMRESSTGFEFRHLLSEKYGFQSYYKMTGLITDRTSLIGQDGFTKLDNIGVPIGGYRGYFKFNGFLAATKNLFITADYLWTSDPSFMYIYKFVYIPYRKNNLTLNYVSDTDQHSIQLINYQPISLTFDSSYIPTVMPVIRSLKEFNFDSIKGSFYYDFQSSYINRQIGLNHFQSRIRLGHKMLHIFDSGIRLKSDINYYFEYHNISQNAGNSITPIQANYLSFYGAPSNKLSSLEQLQYIYGNYSYYLNSSTYLSDPSINGNIFKNGINGIVYFDYPLLAISEFGRTIIKPIVGIKGNIPFGGVGPFLNDTAYLTTLNYLNFYNPTPGNGLSIYDYGIGLITGFNFVHKYNELTISHNIAHEYKFLNPWSSHITHFSGFRANSSSFVGTLDINISNSIISTTNYRFSSEGKLYELYQNLSFTIFEKFLIGLNYTYIAREASYLMREVSLFGFFTRFYILKNLYIAASMNFNFSKESSYAFPEGKVGLVSTVYSIFYEHKCFMVGLSLAQNYFTVGQSGQMVFPALIIRPKISFDVNIKPGSRKLPKKDVYGAEDF